MNTQELLEYQKDMIKICRPIVDKKFSENNDKETCMKLPPLARAKFIIEKICLYASVDDGDTITVHTHPLEVAYLLDCMIRFFPDHKVSSLGQELIYIDKIEE